MAIGIFGSVCGSVLIGPHAMLSRGVFSGEVAACLTVREQDPFSLEGRAREGPGCLPLSLSSTGLEFNSHQRGESKGAHGHRALGKKDQRLSLRSKRDLFGATHYKHRDESLELSQGNQQPNSVQHMCFAQNRIHSGPQWPSQRRVTRESATVSNQTLPRGSNAPWT